VDSAAAYGEVVRVSSANAAAALGARVRSLRKDRGLSQEAFAAQAAIDRSYMGGIERGERNVTLETLVRLANALGISLAELVEGV
jgi:transcriptional regulator with XRE-family HTH domain